MAFTFDVMQTVRESLSFSTRLSNSFEALEQAERLPKDAWNEMLWTAVYHSDVRQCQLCIDKGADFTLPKEGMGDNALHLAAFLGRTAIVGCFIKRSQHPNVIEIKDDCGFTPLFLALMNDKTDCFNYLLEEGADPTTATPWQYTNKLICQQAGGLRIGIKTKTSVSGRFHDDLLFNGLVGQLDPKEKDFWKNYILWEAAGDGKKETCRRLLQQGANANETVWTHSPVCHAAWKGHEGIVELFAANGANLEQKDRWGMTLPEIRSCRKERDSIGKYLSFSEDVYSTYGEPRHCYFEE